MMVRGSVRQTGWASITSLKREASGCLMRRVAWRTPAGLGDWLASGDGESDAAQWDSTMTPQATPRRVPLHPCHARLPHARRTARLAASITTQTTMLLRVRRQRVNYLSLGGGDVLRCQWATKTASAEGSFRTQRHKCPNPTPMPWGMPRRPLPEPWPHPARRNRAGRTSRARRVACLRRRGSGRCGTGGGPSGLPPLAPHRDLPKRSPLRSAVDVSYPCAMAPPLPMATSRIIGNGTSCTDLPGHGPPSLPRRPRRPGLTS